MPALFSPSRHFLLFLLLSLAAQAEVTEVPALESLSTQKNYLPEGWEGKLEAEAESTRDKKNRTNGYELQSELELAKAVGESWAVVGGVSWGYFSKRDLDYSSHSAKKKSRSQERELGRAMDEAFLGARYRFRSLGLKWETNLAYSYLWEREKRIKKGHDGALSAELRSKIKMASWAETKFRFEAKEYLRTRGGDGLDSRRTSMEASPELEYGNFALGLQNRLSHRFKVGSSRSSMETAPYVGFEKGALELSLSVAYEPFVSNDGQLFARAWSKRAVYAAELELSL